jgi:hypothetical protein
MDCPLHQFRRQMRFQGSIFLFLSKVIFKISCIIFYNIDLHNCEQIFTHLHLNLSGKAFKVGDQHFSSVSDTLNGLK